MEQLISGIRGCPMVLWMAGEFGGNLEPQDGVGKEKPALIPAFSPREKGKRLPRPGKMTAIDLRRFRGSMREFLRRNLSPFCSGDSAKTRRGRNARSLSRQRSRRTKNSFKMHPGIWVERRRRTLKNNTVSFTRTKTGRPERFAQEACGHNSKAVHQAYAKRALMKIPSLEEYERKATTKNG
jgi:hypothetical protein